MWNHKITIQNSCKTPLLVLRVSNSVTQSTCKTKFAEFYTVAQPREAVLCGRTRIYCKQLIIPDNISAKGEGMYQKS